jgi:replicative DNA helicase
MSALGERTLIQHLTDPESLEVLAREGLSLDVIPTEELRRVIVFSLDYFHQNGRNKAPSEAVLRTEYGDLLDDHEIALEAPEDSIEWAIDDLKGTYVFKESQSFNKRFATDRSEAETGDRVDVLTEYASELVRQSMKLQDHQSFSDAREGLKERMAAYDERALDRDRFYGMTFGLDQIDAYTRGIHLGELAILAAGPKVGKSYMLGRVALEEWRRGKTVVLYTLENSVEMTLDRIACLATGTNSRDWQRGAVNPDQVEAIKKVIEEMSESDHPLYVIQPPVNKRMVEHFVREAQLLGADSLLIDQLTFITPPDSSIPRTLQIRDITHELKTMISTGRDRMPCLMAHQINREGVKAAAKTGYLEMHHLAESSEVERTADWVFSLYRSKDEVATNMAKFQTLAARREDPRHFQMNWNVGVGLIGVRNQIELD